MTSTRNYLPCFLIVGLSLCAPFTAKSGSIDVNGICEVGCSSPNFLTNGMSDAGAFNFVYTFGDGDAYDIAGNYGASYSTVNGSTISIAPEFTYEGTNPSVGTDQINLIFSQGYFDTSCCTWAGTYTETVPLSLSSSAGPGSTISGQLQYDGQSVGLVGPFGPGTYFVTQSANLDFGALDNSPDLLGDYQFSVKFARGALPGASAGSTNTPEPVTPLLCGLGLIMLGGFARSRKRSGKTS
jgi:hypothetical protein